MTERDSNDTLFYLAIKTKRLVRDNLRDHLTDLWNTASDTTNAIARSFLGLLVVVFSLLAEICQKGQSYCIRKGRQPNANS